MSFKVLFSFILLGVSMSTILSLFGLNAFPFWVFLIPIIFGGFFFFKSFYSNYSESEFTKPESSKIKKKKSSGLKIKW